VAPIVPHQFVKNYNFLIPIFSLFVPEKLKTRSLFWAENFPNVEAISWLCGPLEVKLEGALGKNSSAMSTLHQPNNFKKF